MGAYSLKAISQNMLIIFALKIYRYTQKRLL